MLCWTLSIAVFLNWGKEVEILGSEILHSLFKRHLRQSSQSDNPAAACLRVQGEGWSTIPVTGFVVIRFIHHHEMNVLHK